MVGNRGKSRFAEISESWLPAKFMEPSVSVMWSFPLGVVVPISKLEVAATLPEKVKSSGRFKKDGNTVESTMVFGIVQRTDREAVCVWEPVQDICREGIKGVVKSVVKANVSGDTLKDACTLPIIVS